MRKKIFYGWWIVLATNIICMLGYGTWLYSFGVFFKPMMAEFGWTRAMTAGAYSLRSVEGGIAAPLVGWAVDKYGSRKIIIIGALISGLGFALMPLISSLLGFYLFYGVVLSIGMSAMLYLPADTVLAKWFVRKLSRALAVLKTGAGFGGLICAPIAAVLITHLGWRSAFLVLGVSVWVIVIPLALVVRNSPEEKGLRPDGDPPFQEGTEKADTSSELKEQISALGPAEDYTLKQALSSPTYWFLCAAFFFQSMAHSVVIVHSVPHLTDVGISPERAAFCLGLLTLVSVVGRLLFGYLGDIIVKRYLFMFAYFMEACGVLVLMTVRTMPQAYLFIALFGIGFGGTVPLAPAIRAEYFGRAAFGKIQGFMTPITMLSSAVGPIFAGYLYDTTGSYHTSFLSTGLLTFLAIVIIFFAKPARHPLPERAQAA